MTSRTEINSHEPSQAVEQYEAVNRDIERAAFERWVRVAGAFALKEETPDDQEYMYILDMFPFPSGTGLHMGHVKGYTATDAIAHYHRRNGKEVLHPMGFDAFGLPAETAAINENMSPEIYVKNNINIFKQQLKELGLVYDWDGREVVTSDPEYFKWTQETFLDMFAHGVARYDNAVINWCPHCATALANEDLDSDNTHDRCGMKVERVMQPQWLIDIRADADRLLDNLNDLPEWEREIVEAQVNWIGKKEGYVVSGSIRASGTTVQTRLPGFLEADELTEAQTSGATNLAYVTLSPEKAAELADYSINFSDEVLKFISDHKFTSQQDRRGDSINTSFLYRVGELDIPVRISDSVNDKSFGVRIDVETSSRTAAEETKRINIDQLIQDGLAVTGSSYRMDDWIFSRQRYWGEPIPIVRDSKGIMFPLSKTELPLLLPEVEKVPAGMNGESPLAQMRDWVEVRGRIDSDGSFHVDNDCEETFFRETLTMPNWAGSSWYFNRYLDPHQDTELADKVMQRKFPVVDIYVGGMEHAARHLIYARFWQHFLSDHGIVATQEPFKRVQHVGIVLGSDGKKMSKSKNNGVNPSDMVKSYSGDATRLGMFEMGDFAKSTVWDEAKIAASYKFLQRLWNAKEKVTDAQVDEELMVHINSTIKTVEASIESFRFNSAISSIKYLFNILAKRDVIPREAYETTISLLQPFAPHIAESLIQSESGTESVTALRAWPMKYENVKSSESDKPSSVILLNGNKIVGNYSTNSENSIEEFATSLGFVIVKIVEPSSKKVVAIVRPN